MAQDQSTAGEAVIDPEEDHSNDLPSTPSDAGKTHRLLTFYLYV